MRDDNCYRLECSGSAVKLRHCPATVKRAPCPTNGKVKPARQPH
jgi:hypothetical protein